MLKNLLITLFIFLNNFPFLSGNDTFNIIIDTDCGIDDYRAISFFLTDKRFNILCFIVSEGSLNVKDGSNKLYSLLKAYNKEKIPIFCNEHKIPLVPEWRNFNRKLKWARKIYNCPYKNLNEFIEFFKASDQKYTFIGLGSLNSASIILQNNNFKEKIDRIIWYNNQVENKLSGFNYLCDTSAANFVLQQSSVRVDVISNILPEILIFDKDLYRITKLCTSTVSKNFYRIHSSSEAFKKLKQKHFILHDELVYFYLIKPEIFLMNKSKKYNKVRYCIDINAHAVIFLFRDILNDIPITVEGIVLKNFPYEADNFDYDLRFYVDSIKSKHGIEEWKAAILTNEIHGHLGIYSIVGVKMGILAREYFNVGIDELHVYSFAGYLPPFSCLNDGLQISTGATLGRGTIHIIDQKSLLPQAIFINDKNAILIKLKDDIEKEIKSEISNAVVKFGLEDQSYWSYVRFLAIKYWYKLDRNNIFEIVKLDQQSLKEYNINNVK